MTKTQGERLKLGQVKTAIISCILESANPVSEPEIRKYLKNKFDIRDQGTINKHVHQLKDLGCIESSKSVEKSRSNFWNIKTLENLKNIHTNYPNIHLNMYEKVLAIVLIGNGYTIYELVGLQLYMRLFLSPSFFNMCLETDFETMCLHAWKIYKQNKMINFQNTIEKFRTELQNDPDTNTIDFESLTGTFTEIVKELPLNTPTIKDDDFWDFVDEKITQSQPDEYLAGFLSFMIMDYLDIFNTSLLVLLSDHFCDHDILLDVASDDEIKFVAKTNDNLTIYSKSRKAYIDNDAFEKWTSDDLENISEIIFDFKTPSFFPVHNNSKDLYQYLLKFYENDLKIKKIPWGSFS